MKFEFDKDKSRANQEKHGIDFIEAQELWEDCELIEFLSDQSTESRFLDIGRIRDKHWTAIITYRNEQIRIISVRRSRTKEIYLYENT